MLLNCPGAKIAGNLLVLPPREHKFEEDAIGFDLPLARSLKLKDVMGYGTRRSAPDSLTVSDLVVYGLHHLRDAGHLDLASLDGLILVTQSPDHFVPFTSALVHGRAGLKQDMLLLDIVQGCAGFLVGAVQALSWLRDPAIRRLALVTADVLSRKVSPRDRNSLPLAGDAAAITIFDKADDQGTWPASIRFDGSRAEALKIPAGGFRQPSTPKTAELKSAGTGNWRADDHLTMDGGAVFNFVMNEVPDLILDLYAKSGRVVADTDLFLVHQPNRFMLNKLAERLDVPYVRMPDWVAGKFGNSNSVTIPAAMSECPELLNETRRVCFAGFGVGLTWAAMLATIGPLSFNEQCQCP